MYRKIFFEHTFPLVTPSHSPASSTLLTGSSVPMSLIHISPHHISNLTDQSLSVICSSISAYHGTPLSRSAEKKSPDFSPYPEELPACIYGTIRGQEFISHG